MNLDPSQNLVAFEAPNADAIGLPSGANQAGTYMFGSGKSGGTTLLREVVSLSVLNGEPAKSRSE